MSIDVTEDVKAKELENLRTQARELGLEFHPNLGAERLSALIAEAVAPKEQPEEAEAPKKESKLNDRRNKALKLVRVIVTPNDPNKRDYDGEFFSVGNSVIGTITKFVPFNNDNGWHVPQMIVDSIRDKKMQRFKKVRTAGGVEVKVPTYSPAYAIQILPALTQKELDELGESQRARQAID